MKRALISCIFILSFPLISAAAEKSCLPDEVRYKRVGQKYTVTHKKGTDAATLKRNGAVFDSCKLMRHDIFYCSWLYVDGTNPPNCAVEVVNIRGERVGYLRVFLTRHLDTGDPCVIPKLEWPKSLTQAIYLFTKAMQTARCERTSSIELLKLIPL